MKTFKTKNGLELPLMDMRGKDYLQVAWRVAWMRDEHADWSIETELLLANDKEALAKATIKDGTGRVLATSHKSETMKDFPAGHSEKAETGAIGRALALCGYGTQFAPEFDEDQRIVDSPIARDNHVTPRVETRVDNQGLAPPGDSGAWMPGMANQELRIPAGKSRLAGTPLHSLTVDQMRDTLGWWEGALSKEGKTIESAPPAWRPVLLAIRDRLDGPKA